MASPLRQWLAILLLLLSFSATANRVVVFGTVKFPNGAAAVNFPVKIQTDTIYDNCQISKSILTNQNGAYEGDLQCDRAIEKVIISYYDCAGHFTRLIKEVPATLLVEYNIQICAPTNCHAVFAWEHSSTNPLSIQFSSSNSTAGTPFPDEIISRTWSWGDGGPLTDGNIVNPVHNFTNAGTFDICLKIGTRNGCFSYSCQKLVVGTNTQNCKANYGWQHATDNRLEFRFSDSSKAAPGDSIISRYWFWGDGTATDGNLVHPAHAFPHDSTYTVCLKITTREGCFSYSCQKVVAGTNAQNCKANYGWRTATNNHLFYYFFDSSKAVAGDSIISRIWSWGDGSFTEGNIAGPTHVFAHDSTYTVCLKITTREGCRSYSCQKVVVGTNTQNCKANYGWQHATDNRLEFHFYDSSKAAPGDSIISRYWFWGDGTATDGNLLHPAHVFPHDSIYTVCLKITTREGCFSYSCQKVIVGTNPQNCRANYGWQRATNNQLEFLFSDSSKAASGDSIISRYWFWGDGTATDGNLLHPAHAFPHDSIYTVCLKITTREGCFSYSCQKVIVGTNPQNCRANYGWQRATNNQLEFLFSDSSKAASGDSIISRYWFWGDGTATDGDLLHPAHAFPHDSIYTVCLKITTREGCFSYSCQKVVAGTNTQNCKANYGWQHATNNQLEFHFSDSSKAASGDSIISRYWFWGDGTATDGNLVHPAHAFPHDSTYTVCLKITTANGCFSYSCHELKVITRDTSCKANYGWRTATNNHLFHYFFDSSKAVAGDSIISRIWSWGDGSFTEGNIAGPTHVFAHDSTYNVCLKITTREGCFSYSCQKVVVGTNTQNCKANYGWQRATNNQLEFHFYDSSKAASGDSIISRYWFWGDGTATDGNLVHPAHAFPHDSIYTVCLKITTREGCFSYSCQKVVVGTSTQNCKANYGWQRATNNQLEFHFYDSSKAAAGDSIISRYWFWGDGTATDGNLVHPAHAFPHDSTYTVCLKITTREGCRSYSCQKVIVGTSTENCRAIYGWQQATDNRLEFHFSDSSKAAPGDSIISRYWFWGDGSATDGNLVHPAHAFPHDSTYTVCLKITTREGCRSYSCQKVIVGTSTENCRAIYGWQQATDNRLEFRFSDSSKAAPGDSIISRYWFWGDGSATDGNLVHPAHAFPHDSTYTVCLKITTREGCRSYSCQKVVVTSNGECTAYFYWKRYSETFVYKFFDTSSARDGDEIIIRQWSWGDGSPVLNGNEKYPVHQFPGPGNYEVCLNIKTQKGCEKRICKTLVLAANTCKATFGWEPISNTSTNYIKFFSGQSTGTGGDDHIVGRKWTFGDGTSIISNDSSLIHAYEHGGRYTVCLYIKTSQGCYDSVCREVIVSEPQTQHCEAAFRFEQVTGDGPKSYVKFFSGNSIATGGDDHIVGRRWTFGDGTSLTSNDSNVVRVYEHGGRYTVCLYIKTARGCYDSLCKEIKVNEPPAPHCEAAFRFEQVTGDGPKSYVKFFSGNSIATGGDDHIIGRKWTFGDGTSLISSDSNLVHAYEHGGQYTVCLYIKTARGCYDSVCKEVIVSEPQTQHCEAAFTWTNEGLNFQFNSNNTSISPGDSIVKRYWSFGDSTYMDGNVKDPHHVYLHGGRYEVCLAIVTRFGCHQKICKLVATEVGDHKCYALFKYENVPTGKIRFNSSGAYSLIAGDSIIKRIWYFGDGSVLGGNIINPLHEYRCAGTYTSCLGIVTASGCDNHWCQQIKVDGENRPDSSVLKLIEIFPNPATDHLYVSVWSKYPSIAAELSIYDVYGIKRWSKQIMLPAGNSTWPVPTGFLLAGPYILRLTTNFGAQHRYFIKLN